MLRLIWKCCAQVLAGPVTFAGIGVGVGLIVWSQEPSIPGVTAMAEHMLRCPTCSGSDDGEMHCEWIIERSKASARLAQALDAR